MPFHMLAGLTKLDLRQSGFPDESQLEDRGAQDLSTLVHLEHLNLAGHRSLTSSGVAFLSSFTRLSGLCLAGESHFENLCMLVLDRTL